MRSVRPCSAVIYDGERSLACGVCLSFNQRRRIVHFVFFFFFSSFREVYAQWLRPRLWGCNFVLLWIFFMCLSFSWYRINSSSNNISCARDTWVAEFFSNDRRERGKEKKKKKSCEWKTKACYDQRSGNDREGRRGDRYIERGAHTRARTHDGDLDQSCWDLRTYSLMAAEE